MRAAASDTPMKVGFGIVVFADDYIETYVVNVRHPRASRQVVSAGSAMLSNASKTQRGAPRQPAAGSMVWSSVSPFAALSSRS